MSYHIGCLPEQTSRVRGRRRGQIAVDGRRPVGVRGRRQRGGRRCDCLRHFMNVVNRSSPSCYDNRVQVSLSGREKFKTVAETLKSWVLGHRADVRVSTRTMISRTRPQSQHELTARRARMRVANSWSSLQWLRRRLAGTGRTREKTANNGLRALASMSCTVPRFRNYYNFYRFM